jgi:hypothetical protein
MPVRKRKEVQEMLWRLSSFLAFACLLPAAGLAAAPAILPESISDFVRAEEKPVALNDRPLWDELGYDDDARADYAGPDGKFTLTVIRMKDSTGAMAAFECSRPAGAKPSKFDRLAVETPRTLYLAFGNYLFQYDGRQPKAAEFEALLARLPRLEKTALPPLPGNLPKKGRIEGSERYILGPVSLERFAPAISPGTAGFSTGAEGIAGSFSTPSGDLRLAIFSYPTPHIARERIAEFQKIQGAIVKRSGPLVAVALPPANADAAERLLADVRYEAQITLNQRVPAKDENVGTMIVSIFTLAGILILFATAAGVAFGGFRVLWKKVTGHEIAGDPIIVLNLRDR